MLTLRRLARRAHLPEERCCLSSAFLGDINGPQGGVDSALEVPSGVLCVSYHHPV